MCAPRYRVAVLLGDFGDLGDLKCTARGPKTFSSYCKGELELFCFFVSSLAGWAMGNHTVFLLWQFFLTAVQASYNTGVILFSFCYFFRAKRGRRGLSVFLFPSHREAKWLGNMGCVAVE